MGQLTRIKRIKQDRFTAVSNAVLLDRDLSLKAKGFLILVMSLHDDWDFTVRGMISIVKEGRDAVYGSIKELIEAGYCKREQTPGRAGKFAEVVYVFTEEKWDFQPHTALPYTEQPYTGSPYTENPPQINTKEIKDLTKQRLKGDGASEDDASQPAGETQDSVEKPAQRRGSRLPSDFAVSDRMKVWAGERAPAVDLVTETEKFENYYRSVAGGRGVKLDWEATWRNWVLKAVKEYGNGTNGQRRPDRRPTNAEILSGYSSIFEKYR